jgi:hypothetical protein
MELRRSRRLKGLETLAACCGSWMRSALLSTAGMNSTRGILSLGKITRNL